MNTRNICVFDFETDGVNPHKCSPVQLAAIMIHPRTLDIIPNSEFNSYMKPVGIDNMDKYLTSDIKGTANWHAKNYSSSLEDILKTWKEAPSAKVVWTNFIEYVHKYNPKTGNNKKWGSPICAGQNILNFDIPILERLCKKYKTKFEDLFSTRDKIDMMQYCFFLFENTKEPRKYSMDYLKNYFKMPDDESEQAHDALGDVRVTAKMIIRFQKYMRRISEKTTFAGAFANA